MKYLLSLIVLISAFLRLEAQKYIAKDGYIGFFSSAPLEDIKADNNQAAGVIDITTGEIVFQVYVRSFHFKKALMEEHFNENYMESEKYPKATFKGKIKDISAVNFSRPGKYDVAVEGDMTIRSVTKKISVQGVIEVSAEGFNAGSKFKISPEDYEIKIPAIVRENIAKIVEVTVDMKFTRYEGN
jgi:polyisoprenoid-binding protein YceI